MTIKNKQKASGFNHTSVTTKRLSIAATILTLHIGAAVADPVIPGNILFDELWGLNDVNQDLCNVTPVLDGQGGYTCSDIETGSIDFTTDPMDIDLNAPEGWAAFTEGNHEVVIALLDTGIDITHPDLAPKLWLNSGELVDGICVIDGTDADNNGFIDDCYGINTREDWLIAINEEPTPICATYKYDGTYHSTLPTGCELNPAAGQPTEVTAFDHGTYMASHIIANYSALSSTEQGGVVGLAGYAPNVKLVTCAAAGLQISSTLPIALPYAERDAVIACFDYFLDLKLNKGVNIVAINGSGGAGQYFNLGGALYGEVFEQYILNTPEVEQKLLELNDADILLIAAAGNTSEDIDVPIRAYYPAASMAPNVISVASVNQTGNKSGFSSYGRYSVDIAAPGSRTVGAKLGGSYTLGDGTSQATAYVSALVALIKANASTEGLNAAQVRRLVISSGKKLDSLEANTSSGSIARLVGTGDEVGALNCQSSIFRRRQAPRQDFHILLPGEQITFEVQSYDCSAPTGEANLTVNVSADGVLVSSFSLADNGQGEDERSNDGVYTGTWTVESEYTAYALSFGTDTVTGVPDTVLVSSELIHDNTDEHSMTNWAWLASTYGADYYGSNYYFASTNGRRYLTWEIDLPSSGNYDLYARWPSRPGTIFASNTQYVVEDINNTTYNVSMDQSQLAGEWVLVGNYDFASGANNITVRNYDDNNTVTANGKIVADAVKLVKISNL